MSSQILSANRSIVLLGVALVWGVVFAVPTDTARADECLTAPKSPTPKGGHWYYRTDRVKNRKCWFLRLPAEPAQQPAAEAKATAKAASASVTRAAVPEKHANAGAKDCLTAPKYAAPKGSHWYYHTDRAHERKCWHLGTAVERPQTTATDVKPDAASTVHAGTPKRVKASANVLPSNSVAGGARTSPPLEPKAAQQKSAVADVAIKHEVKGETVTPSIDETPTQKTSPREANAPWPTGERTVRMASDVDTVWGDRPAAAAVKAPQPISAPSDARPDPVLPTEHTPKPSHATSVATTSSRPATKARRRAAARATPGMLLLILLVVGAVAILYRFVVKFASMRRRRRAINRSESDWFDDWHQRKWDDDEPVARQWHLEDNEPSLVPLASDLQRGGAFETHHAPPQRNEHTERVARFFNQVTARENALKELIRELDEMLQTRKEA